MGARAGEELWYQADDCNLRLHAVRARPLLDLQYRAERLRPRPDALPQLCDRLLAARADPRIPDVRDRQLHPEPRMSARTLLAFLVAAGCTHSRSGVAPDGGDNGDGGALSPACAAALSDHSYIGCDYWPTVTMNPVWSVFDYTVVVANTGSMIAEVSVTGPNGASGNFSIPVGGLEKIYLPWVPALKGPDFDSCAHLDTIPSASIVAPGGAYHLISTQPVTVYQFNALEYRGAGGGEGKDWSKCPGLTGCGGAYGCYSYSNDASLLLPTSALTATYRITGLHGANGGGFGNSPGMSTNFV